MKVKELKALIENWPENATVVISDFDHKYREVKPQLTKAGYSVAHKYFCEYFGDEYLEHDEVVEDVVIFE